MGADSKVTIVIPNFNRASFLLDALDSIRNQTYTNWECIVVDDGSSDSSLDVVESFANQDKRFVLSTNFEGSKGAASARNKGVKESTGKYLIFLDSDDLLMPHCLQQRVDVMISNPDLEFAVFPMLLFYNSPGDSNLLWNVETTEDDLSRFLRLDAVWQTSGPIWRKDALKKLPLFDESLSCWQDVGFHIHILLRTNKYKKFYSLKPDCYYRKNSPQSISQQSLVSKTHLSSRWLLLNKIQENIRFLEAYSSKKVFFSFYFSFLNTLKFKSTVLSLGAIVKYICWYKHKYNIEYKELFVLCILSLFKISRLTKFPFINSIYSYKVKELVPPSAIGKHAHSS